MRSRKPSKKQMESLCSDVHDDDGKDPRFYPKKSYRRKQSNGRKTKQLCGQVAKALNYALSGECNDDLLRNLYVIRVDPAPDQTRLLVTLEKQLPDEVSIAEIIGRLNTFSGQLRYAVSEYINRRKTPELTFCVAASLPE